jgi:hypothetical protein
MRALRSIKTRIFAGFLLLLLLLGGVAGMVWHASTGVDQALRSDAASAVGAARFAAMQAALLEARV